MPIIVKCLGSASGQPMGAEGQYLKDYDLEFDQGIGWVDFAVDAAGAMRFEDIGAFHRVYKSVPVCKPLRADGLPNRPLTATHWEIVSVEE